MAETDKIGNGLNHFSSQFLEKFDPRKELSRVNSKVEDEEEEGEIELSLGLSLNGRFGVDPKGKNLIRSCSVSDFNLNPDGEIETTRIKPVEYTHLTRTTSLPTEAEEEWRVRKEMQMVRRMETKRKRSEKQRTVRGIPVPWVKGWSMGHEFESNPELGNSGGSGPPPLARSGSSVISRVDSKRDQGLVKTPESTEHSEQNLTAVSTETKTSDKANEDVTEKCKPKPSGPTRATSELVRNLLADMPCVSTKGNGPGGKRIEGFLYGYKKGEEVRIVCVCHGSFLTPAEFVRHAGGGDVEHPLKHIVVNPSPFL